MKRCDIGRADPREALVGSESRAAVRGIAVQHAGESLIGESSHVLSPSCELADLPSLQSVDGGGWKLRMASHVHDEVETRAKILGEQFHVEERCFPIGA